MLTYDQYEALCVYAISNYIRKKTAGENVTLMECAGPRLREAIAHKQPAEPETISSVRTALTEFLAELKNGHR